MLTSNCNFWSLPGYPEHGRRIFRTAKVERDKKKTKFNIKLPDQPCTGTIFTSAIAGNR